MKMTSKKKDNLKNEDNLENENHLKNEDKNEKDLTSIELKLNWG